MRTRNPTSFPKVLGVTDPMVCPTDNCPVVQLNEQQDATGYLAWFSPATCAAPPLEAYCAGAQDLSYGKAMVAREGGLVTWPFGAPNPILEQMDLQVFDAKNAPSGAKYLEVIVRIDDMGATMIRDSEQEHGDDYAHAFALSVQCLTDAINSLGSYQGATAFDARTAALQALAAAVPPALVPAEPHVLWKWRNRAAAVCSEIAELTEERDTGPDAEHKASWYAAFTADTLLIYPAPPPRIRPSAALITLAGVDVATPDWSAPAATPAPTHQYKVLNTVLVGAAGRDVVVRLFGNEARTGDPSHETTLGAVDDYTYRKGIDLVVHQLLSAGYVLKARYPVTDGLEADVYFEALDAHL